MRVLSFGTYDVRAHPRVGILIDGLRDSGCDVVEANVALGLDTATRVSMLKDPRRLGLLARRLLRCWIGLVRASRRRRRPPPDVVLVGYLGHFDVLLARVLFPRTPIVLDHLIFAADTALDRGVTGSTKGRVLGALDRVALRAADLVLLDTAEHAELVPPRYAGKSLVVPVGAPRIWWAARTAARNRPAGPPDAGRSANRPLRVVFFGLFTPLQGTPVVGAALGRLANRADLTALMIGSGQDLEAARQAAAASQRIEWRAWEPPERLQATVAGTDVCLGSFGTSAKAMRVVPNKVFQGAAAGCAIVTADTPPQRRQLGAAAIFVPPGDPIALADALGRLATDPAMLAHYRTAAAELADAQFRPAAVVAPLQARLPELVGGLR